MSCTHWLGMFVSPTSIIYFLYFLTIIYAKFNTVARVTTKKEIPAFYALSTSCISEEAKFFEEWIQLLSLEYVIRVYCSLAWKLTEMDSGVCFALFKVTDESGSKLKNKSVSTLKISNEARVCIVSEVLLTKFILELLWVVWSKQSRDFNVEKKLYSKPKEHFFEVILCHGFILIKEFKNKNSSWSILQLECEVQSMRTAYEELQISFRKREDLEYSTRTRMESEIGKLQENNRNLQGENVFSW